MNTEIRITFNRKVSFAEGHPYGDVGPYERWVGTAGFALDPDDPTNSNIVDLEYAPRNEKGLVEFSADLDILKPEAKLRDVRFSASLARLGFPFHADLAVGLHGQPRQTDGFGAIFGQPTKPRPSTQSDWPPMKGFISDEW